MTSPLPTPRSAKPAALLLGLPSKPSVHIHTQPASRATEAALPPSKTINLSPPHPDSEFPLVPIPFSTIRHTLPSLAPKSCSLC